MSVLEGPDLGEEGYAYCKCFISLLLSNIQLSYYAADALKCKYYFTALSAALTLARPANWYDSDTLWFLHSSVVKKSPTVFCYVSFKNGVQLHNVQVQKIVNKVGATSDQ